MVLKEIERLVATGIPGSRANAEALGADLTKMAIAALGRMDGVDFNATRKSFSFVAGTDEYEIGSALFANVGNVISLEGMYLTDISNSPVSILPTDKFDAYASGSSISGRPTIAKAYFKGKKPYLKVYPNPDSAYPAEVTLRTAIDSFNDIPVHLHEIIVRKGLVFAAALGSGNLADKLAEEGVKDMVDDSISKWNGSTIALARHMGNVGAGMNPDSGNLRP